MLDELIKKYEDRQTHLQEYLKKWNAYPDGDRGWQYYDAEIKEKYNREFIQDLKELKEQVKNKSCTLEFANLDRKMKVILTKEIIGNND